MGEPEEDKSNYHVCGGCWQRVRKQAQLPQEPYLPEKQQRVLALVREEHCLWHEFKSHWLELFGCERLLSLGNLVAALAASITLVDVASLVQVRGARVCSAI